MSAELKELTALANHLVLLDKEIEEVEKHLSQLKRDRTAFSREHIPDVMADIGVREFTLEDGSKVSIDVKVYANISEDRAPFAMKWLRNTGNASLIKTTMKMDFRDGLEDRVDCAMVQQFLKKNQINFVEKEEVHPQTLKAFVRTQLDTKDFPRETFGVFVTDETLVEKNKNT